MYRIWFVIISLFFTGQAIADGTNYSQLLNEGGILLDVRTQQEFEQGHWPNAVLLPYDQLPQHNHLLPENMDTPILLYCRSGRRSGIASSELKAMGYNNVHNLGGLKDLPPLLSHASR